ncbi:MAG: hypothetical protein EOP06_20320 [Proteobacteria bacterium]|nr:MAG: hypothetical protein EOP06_20320 [Pseudomonadota bacterium]
MDTLALLRKYKLNFSFDILFALPSQTLEGLTNDVEIAMQQGAKHLSPYCLTVPESHPLAKGRPLEDEQVAMFDAISDQLTAHGYNQYEISNFSQPGFESRHNILYWTDEEYWGLGLSAHSYSKSTPWGLRFWNPSNINDYQNFILSGEGRLHTSPAVDMPADQREILLKNQSLTDFCHTSMRLMRGLDPSALAAKFSENTASRVLKIMDHLQKHGWVEVNELGHFALTKEGLILSNQIFAQLTFLEDEI